MHQEETCEETLTLYHTKYHRYVQTILCVVIEIMSEERYRANLAMLSRKIVL